MAMLLGITFLAGGFDAKNVGIVLGTAVVGAMFAAARCGATAVFHLVPGRRDKGAAAPLVYPPVHQSVSSRDWQ